MLTKKRGGSRPNSGAKPKYNEPTKTISFRVPLSHIEPLKEYVNNYLRTLKTTTK